MLERSNEKGKGRTVKALTRNLKDLEPYRVEIIPNVKVIGDGGSGIGDRGSGIGDRGSGIGDGGSGIGDGDSLFKRNPERRTIPAKC